MAFGKRGENVTHNSSLLISAKAPVEKFQEQYEQFKQKIEIRKDGNYIDNKLFSLQEIAKKGQEWYKGSNEWIFLLIDESVPLNRVDEVRKALTDSYWVVQSPVNSIDFVYFAGDVSDMAKFKQGSFNDWINSQLNNYPEVKNKAGKYSLTFSFIIGKNGKVRDGHVIEGTDTEINSAYEKILAQIPDWEPAKRNGENVSVYNQIMAGGTVVINEVK